ncbi:conserved hypothetical protein [Acinetobacter proteolyticus]|uniref:Uncharacterized protein n=1 Tax=Acinetobacter proteolyticus TaxID=1776741 RepID=A0A653K222_9GAMM|nr:conserved hypothetical protein [Acinetobacter proteolyticus]
MSAGCRDPVLTSSEETMLTHEELENLPEEIKFSLGEIS